MHTLRFPLFAIVLILVGTVMLLHRLHVVSMDWITVLWGVVALAGAFKIFNGFTLKRRGGVFWGLLFLALGTFALLHEFGVIDPEPGFTVAGLLLTLGTAFLLMFLTVPRDWYVLVPSAFFLLVGGGVLCVELGYFNRWDVSSFLGAYWPLALIAFGAALLLNRTRRT